MIVKEQLKQYETLIKTSKRITPLSSKEWRKGIPKESGVYVIWESDLPVYVGETSSLYSRMGDLSRPINHAFTKKAAALLNIKETELEKLAKAMSEKYKLAYMPVNFGRAEIEEYLILRWRNTLINKPTKRLLKSDQYSWVNAV